MISGQIFVREKLRNEAAVLAFAFAEVPRDRLNRCKGALELFSDQSEYELKFTGADKNTFAFVPAKCAFEPDAVPVVHHCDMLDRAGSIDTVMPASKRSDLRFKANRMFAGRVGCKPAKVCIRFCDFGVVKTMQAIEERPETFINFVGFQRVIHRCLRGGEGIVALWSPSFGKLLFVRTQNGVSVVDDLVVGLAGANKRLLCAGSESTGYFAVQPIASQGIAGRFVKLFENLKVQGRLEGVNFFAETHSLIESLFNRFTRWAKSFFNIPAVYHQPKMAQSNTLGQTV